LRGPRGKGRGALVGGEHVPEELTNRTGRRKGSHDLPPHHQPINLFYLHATVSIRVTRRFHRDGRPTQAPRFPFPGQRQLATFPRHARPRFPFQPTQCRPWADACVKQQSRYIPSTSRIMMSPVQQPQGLPSQDGARASFLAASPRFPSRTHSSQTKSKWSTSHGPMSLSCLEPLATRGSLSQNGSPHICLVI